MNKKHILLAVAALALAACSSTPSTRRAPVDNSWTAPAAMQRAEAERPRGLIEAWERKRPAEFNRPEAE
ncbi:MAG: lipoprotein [Comamonadaceae bacterium]|nr:lipoprotein [Comamonadaceae bacterium]